MCCSYTKILSLSIYLPNLYLSYCTHHKSPLLQEISSDWYHQSSFMISWALLGHPSDIPVIVLLLHGTVMAGFPTQIMTP